MTGAPDDKNSGLKDFAKAESMIQLAIIMPAACVIGWLLGALMDRWLHTEWIYVAGILLGAVAGFVQIYRVASGYMRSAK
jgi:F0F1-type ATP synthase assembly protein I